MKRSIIVFLVLTFATSSLGNSILGFEVDSDSPEAPKEPSLLILGAEELGAVGCGAAMGVGAFVLTLLAVHEFSGSRHLTFEERNAADMGGKLAGYALGFPLGSALGASTVGGLAEQGGSFWWSWAGAELATIAALGFAAVFGEAFDGAFALPISALAPPTGAVVGYNVSKWLKGSKPTGTSSDESVHGTSPGLTLFVPEVQLRQDRFANSLRPRLGRDPTLTYKVTLARLSF